jgi:hypothetical protein
MLRIFSLSLLLSFFECDFGWYFFSVRVGSDGELELVIRLNIADDLQMQRGNPRPARGQVCASVEAGDDDPVIG